MARPGSVDGARSASITRPPRALYLRPAPWDSGHWVAAPCSSLAGPAGRLRRPQPSGLHSGRHRPLLPAPLPPCAWARREAGLSCCAASEGWLIISSSLGRLQALTRLPAAWCPGSEVVARGRPGSRLSCQDWGSRTVALPTSALLSLPLPLTAHTRAHIYMHTFTCTHVYTHVHTRTHLKMHTRACAHARVYTHVHILAQRHSCTRVRVHTCTCVQSHVYTRACTDTRAPMCPHMCAQTDTWFLPTAAPPSDTINGNTYWGQLGVCLQALLSLSSHRLQA